MDEIQRTLIKAGRKDLAQKYYLKIADIKQFASKITVIVEANFELSITDKNGKPVTIPNGEEIQLVSRHSKTYEHRKYPDYITIKYKGKELYVGDWNTGTKFDGQIQKIPFYSTSENK